VATGRVSPILVVPAKKTINHTGTPSFDFLGLQWGVSDISLC
jgi:hypothetical protein